MRVPATETSGRSSLLSSHSSRARQGPCQDCCWHGACRRGLAGDQSRGSRDGSAGQAGILQQAVMARIIRSASASIGQHPRRPAPGWRRPSKIPDVPERLRRAGQVQRLTTRIRSTGRRRSQMTEPDPRAQDRRQAARARLRELTESAEDRQAGAKFLSEEDWLSTTQCCANCVFYRRHSGTKRTLSSSGGVSHKTWDNCYCQRNPPSLVAKELVQLGGYGGNPARLFLNVETAWPETKRTDWCGEYRPLPGFDEAVVPSNRIEGFRQRVGAAGDSGDAQREENPDE